MRVLRLALVAILLVLLAFPVAAQMDQGQGQMDQDQAQTDQGTTDQEQAQSDQNQMDQQQAQADQGQAMQPAFVATAQQGPRVRAGLPMSADVMVNGVLAMRIPASAGGLDPMQRAEVIVDRLNQAFATGAGWQDTQVLQREGLWTVNVGGNLIATADINSARAYNTQTGQLASRWARQSVVAMGGQPQMIAQQLQPVTVAVAGAQQEFGANWAVTPVENVPLVNIADGQLSGDVTVAGSQGNLNRVNAVALFAYSTDGANVWQFVPSTTRQFSGTNVPRVNGVGIVRVSTSILPMTNILTGDEAVGAINQMTPSQWNALINNQSAGWRVQTQASTKVVPMYSLSTNQIVGAAQIVGDANAVGQAQAVVMSEVDGSFAFRATPTAVGQISGQPRTLNNVVISALITFPEGDSFVSPVALIK